MPEQKVRVVSGRVPIRDGFTLSNVYKPDVPVLFSGAAITYRPALQQQTADYMDDPRKYLEKSRELVRKHLVGWNIEGDEPGSVAPINEQTVAELAYPLLSWMVDTVTGYAILAEVADAKN